jgi:hypothetical protein
LKQWQRPTYVAQFILGLTSLFDSFYYVQPEEMNDMLAALRMPSFSITGRSAYRMGYVLRESMIRCGTNFRLPMLSGIASCVFVSCVL